MFKFIGFVVVFVSIFGGYAIEGGVFRILWQPAEILIIWGTGVGALLISTPVDVLKILASNLKLILIKEKIPEDYFKELFMALKDIISQIQSDGMVALEKTLDNPDESPIFKKAPSLRNDSIIWQFIIDNLTFLTIDKPEPHDLEDLLESEIERIEEDYLRTCHSLSNIADAMPGFGILAAVLGMMITMGHVDGDIVTIGVHVAAALMGSFLGIFTCYAVLTPLSKAIESQIATRVAILNAISKILYSYSQGKPMLQILESGRKQIPVENKMSFIELEQLMKEHGRQ